MNLDVYHCVSCQEELAVKHGKAPNTCPFCGDEITFSHTTADDDELERLRDVEKAFYALRSAL